MRATVSTGNGLDSRTVEVNVPTITKMTPQAAIRFRNLAFGVAASATVRGGDKTYHVTGIGSRAKARRGKEN